MAAASNIYKYEGKEAVKLKKWKVQPGSQLLVRTVILTYEIPTSTTGDENKDSHKLESTVDGTVSELLVKEGELIQPGSTLMKLESCKHDVIIKELCAICGADLRHLSSQNLQEVVASRSFSMVHVVPELKCSKKQAYQLDEADEERLLKTRKLILLVDLDQTLIHTTNDNIPADLKDVYHFQLYGHRSPWYHTRLRPHTREFLEKISQFYELHIFTFGARLYAHKIVRSILDPSEIFFSHRILSRDECFDATSKTGNLKVLFPRGDSMVCIIDDREDVWNFAPNVIHVKPYIYFTNTGDINCPKFAPNSTAPTKGVIKSQSTTSAESADLEIISDKPEVVNNDESIKLPVEISENSVVSENSVASENVVTEMECDDVKIIEEPEIQNKEVKGPYDDDDDDYLLYLEEILIRIHRAYFGIYDELVSQKKDEPVKVPDLKTVIPYVRNKVLRGVNLVFSGVIPTNVAPEKSSLWILAKSLGAEIFHDLITYDSPLKTTHIVASKAGTVKLTKAKRVGNIHIVTPSWLMCCATRWERVDERLFPLKKGENLSPLPQQDTPKEKLKIHAKKMKAKLSNKGKHKDLKKKSNKKMQPILDFSAEELANMGREVDEACSSSDEEMVVEQSDHKINRVKRKHSSIQENDVIVLDNNEEICDKVTNNSENGLSSNDTVNGNQSQNNNSDEDEDSSNSVNVISSGEEELVAEMERELFGEL